jgi:hypothetical protein
MTRYWLSWVQPTDDYRPKHDPPAEAVLGWWCSGYNPGDQAVLCAVVAADSEEQARAALLADWPEVADVQFRFIHRSEPHYVPGDRFPLSAWMRLRFGVPDRHERSSILEESR